MTKRFAVKYSLCGGNGSRFASGAQTSFQMRNSGQHRAALLTHPSDVFVRAVEQAITEEECSAMRQQRVAEQHTTIATARTVGLKLGIQANSPFHFTKPNATVAFSAFDGLSG